MPRPGPAASGGRGRRRGALALTAVAALVLGCALSGCSNSGQSLARQACAHVKASLRYYDDAQHAPDAHRAASDRTRAIEELEAALPLAAQANSADPQWNPLMTTLQEIGRNAEKNLVPALRAQCAAADGNDEGTPTATTVPPGE